MSAFPSTTTRHVTQEASEFHSLIRRRVADLIPELKIQLLTLHQLHIIGPAKFRQIS